MKEKKYYLSVDQDERKDILFICWSGWKKRNGLITVLTVSLYTLLIIFIIKVPFGKNKTEK